MASTIIIHPEAVEKDALMQWVRDTQKITGAVISVVERLELTADDPAVSSALKSLFATPEVKGQKKLKRREAPEMATAFRLPSAPAKAVRAWRVLGEDGKPKERISAEERDLRLSKADFPTGTVLHHPKEGKYRVIGRMGGEAQTLTEAV